MTTPPPSPHLSTLTLHQLRYGELGAGDARTARAHVDACEACRQRLNAQQSFRAAFELKAPEITLPSTSTPSVWERLGGWLRPAPLGAVLVAAAAVIAVAVLPGDPADGTRVKGSADVQVIVEGHGALDDGEHIAPGDRLQIRVPAGSGAEAWVGDGDAIIGHFDLQPGAPTLSPFALTVDAEAGDEELILVLSDTPLTEADARDAMSGHRMDGVEIRRLWLPKER